MTATDGFREKCPACNGQGFYKKIGWPDEWERCSCQQEESRFVNGKQVTSQKVEEAQAFVGGKLVSSRVVDGNIVLNKLIELRGVAPLDGQYWANGKFYHLKVGDPLPEQD